jgi:hypothetical protein
MSEIHNNVLYGLQCESIERLLGKAVTLHEEGRRTAPEWVTGMITGCDFPDARRLVAGTWRYLELSVKDYIAKNKAPPYSIAVHPAYVDELLEVLELPEAEQSLLHGIGVAVDLRCVVACLVSENGKFYEI